MIKYNSPRPAL